MKHFGHFSGSALLSPAEALKENGWAAFALEDFSSPPWLASAFGKFAEDIAADLPDDPYDRTGLRKRRYGVFIWVPSANLLLPISREFDDAGEPVVPYFQGAEYQPEFGGEVRWFPGLAEWTLRSPVLDALVKMDGEIAIASGALPPSSAYQVGFHEIALVPRPNEVAVITPNEIHRDGEPVTFVHLLQRDGVTGGWNAVTDISCVGEHPDHIDPNLIRARFSLDMVGDSFVVDDRKVAHYVEGVSLDQPSAKAARVVALIDFCPVRRVLSNEL